MKVHELIEILKNSNQDLEVYVPSKLTEHDYCFVNSVKTGFLTIEESEDYPDETVVLIINEF